jgi:hypothetical protein
MSEIVWASNAMINPAMLRPIMHSFADSGEENEQKTLLAAQGIKDGKVLGKDYFPSEIYVAKDANTNYEKLPHLFYAFGYWVVSGVVADVMRGFDLGSGHLYPTKVFRKDRKTPIGDEWFCLNFGNVKHAFLPDESKGIRPLGPSKTYWKLSDLSDNSLALTSVALSGPDIWIEEIFGDAFFLSGRLAKALKAAGIAGPFGLKKCRII